MMLQHIIAPCHHIVWDGEGDQGTGAHHQRRGLGLLDNELRGDRVLLVSRDGLVGVVVDVDTGGTLKTLRRGSRRGNGRPY